MAISTDDDVNDALDYMSSYSYTSKIFHVNQSTRSRQTAATNPRRETTENIVQSTTKQLQEELGTLKTKMVKEFAGLLKHELNELQTTVQRNVSEAASSALDNTCSGLGKLQQEFAHLAEALTSTRNAVEPLVKEFRNLQTTVENSVASVTAAAKEAADVYRTTLSSFVQPENKAGTSKPNDDGHRIGVFCDLCRADIKG